jgi:hypothetical protein
MKYTPTPEEQKLLDEMGEVKAAIEDEAKRIASVYKSVANAIYEETGQRTGVISIRKICEELVTIGQTQFRRCLVIHLLDESTDFSAYVFATLFMNDEEVSENIDLSDLGDLPFGLELSKNLLDSLTKTITNDVVRERLFQRLILDIRS